MHSQSTYSDVGRVVAIGDLHGNYAGFRKILLETGLIDKRGHWQARNTHLVQLGDILGRGGEPGKIFKLLLEMEAEAPGFDSRVHVLLGNHEAMTMCGLLVYNTLEEFQDMADQELVDPLEAIDGMNEETKAPPTVAAKLDRRMAMLGCREFKASLSPWGRVGKWLGSHDSAVIVNDSLFVHGGLNRRHGCQPLDDLNLEIRQQLGTFSPPDATTDSMLMRDGPQWNRQFTLRPDEKKEKELEEVLDYHACQRMVVGHTPTSCINPAQAGRIIPMYAEKLMCIDTGIGKSYGQNLSALSMEHGEVSALYL